MPEISAFETQKALQSLIRSHAELEAKALVAEDRFMRAIIRSQARMYRRMAEVMASAPNLSSLSLQKRLAWYVESSAAIQSAAKESGYYAAVRSYVNEYPGFGTTASKILAAGRVPKEFTTIPKELIDRIMNRDYAWFDMLNSQAIAQLDKTVLDSLIVGYSNRRALAELKRTITGSYKWGEGRGLYEWHAGTYARTAHVRATREFMAAQADEAGIENFIYIGPLDGKTRPFCVDLVGNVFTKTQIEEMDNGQTGLVMSDGGGWNCRHSWDPVDEDLAKALKETPEQNQAAVQNALPKTPPETAPKTIGTKPSELSTKFSTRDPKGWKPAKSIGEAESWAKSQRLAKRVNYQGLELRVANEMNRRIAMHAREFPQIQKAAQASLGYFTKATRVALRVIGRNDERIASTYDYGRRTTRAAALRRSRQAIAELHPEMTKEQVNALARQKLAQQGQNLDEKADEITKKILRKAGVSKLTRQEFASAWHYPGGEGIVMEDLWFADKPITGWVAYFKKGGVLCWKEPTTGEWVVLKGGSDTNSKSLVVQQAKDALKWGKVSKNRLEMTERNLNRLAENGRFSPNSGPISGTVDHEFGHILDYTFRLSDDLEIRAIIKEYSAKGAAYIRDNLSGYGTANVREFIAEAWAEFVANPTGSREIARRIGTYIVENAGKTL